MFLPILDNPLHKVYRAERQEFSASFDIGSQTTAAPPQHFINHRKSNLKVCFYHYLQDIFKFAIPLYW